MDSAHSSNNWLIYSELNVNFFIFVKKKLLIFDVPRPSVRYFLFIQFLIMQTPHSAAWILFIDKLTYEYVIYVNYFTLKTLNRRSVYRSVVIIGVPNYV